MQIVPRIATPVPLGALQPAITTAFLAEGHPLTPTQAANLTVLAAIETGRGQSMKNHNVGNITAGSRWTGPAWRPPWFDEPAAGADSRTKALHQAMLKGTAPSAFRAYSSLEEGARDYARQLLRTFPEVMAAADQADPNVFRLALGQKYSHDYIANARVTSTIAELQRELGLVAAAGGGAVGLALLLWLAYRFA